MSSRNDFEFLVACILGGGLLSWLPPPTDLKLLEKTDRTMHVAWSPPEIFDLAYKDLITHYLVDC